ELHGRLDDAQVDALLPSSSASGRRPGRTGLAESALSGESARTVVADPEGRRGMLAAATRAIVAIHAAGSSQIVVDDSVLDRWVTARTEVIADTLARRSSRESPAARALATITSAIASDLGGRTLDV